MAGYIFSLNSLDSLHDCIRNGIYSTNLTQPRSNLWKLHHEGTFADYCSMKSGDNIYFFIRRKIYGIGELININGDCKFFNYPQASLPSVLEFADIQNQMILNNSEHNVNNRCICLFQPSPNFFLNGIDMDDVLSSNPKSFRMLRAFWKLSFIKIDDEENKALKDIILKRNESYINTNRGSFTFHPEFQNNATTILNNNYTMSSNNILDNCSNGHLIRHEMAIECAIIDYLSNRSNTVFGHWDYISHQVIASPFKPIDYMDKMDIFGYRYIPGFKTISKYLIIEIKKDAATIDSVDQIMKYVDWVNQEYAYNDYSMIEAFIVASNIPENVTSYRNRICVRNYTKGRRPTVSETWQNVRSIRYVYNQETNTLDFSEIE